MNLFVIGAGCSKAYGESLSKQRMPVAKDFFNTFNQLDNLNTSRWVLVGNMVNALNMLKGTTPLDPFKNEYDIEEIHTMFEKKLFEAMDNEDISQIQLFFKAYTELVFLFSCVVNDIANGPVSKAHVNLAKYLSIDDSIITFNWDVLLDRALAEHTQWSPSNGYFIKPKSIFNSGWKDVENVSPAQSPILLKMHGSANWLTGTITVKPGEKKFQMMQEVPADTYYVYEHANGPFDCWDGRWEKVYEPFVYGYYPPNLPLAGKKLDEGYTAVRMILRGPLHAPKGNHGSRGLVSMPLIIPPVKNKAYEFYGDLFDRIWSKAQEEITRASVITFIGYSFPITDTKTVKLFKDSFSKRASIPVINVIDPEPDRINNLLLFDLGIPESHINIFKEHFSEDFDLNRLKTK